MKKMKIFWSYQVDKTENWLSQMARKGYQLNKFNHLTRVFSFKEGPCENATYAIQIDKQEFLGVLANAGWYKVASSGKWQMLKNENKAPTVFPSRNAIVNRTRLHAYLFLLMTLVYLSLQIPIFIVFGLFSSFESEQFELAPFLILICLFLSLTGLTIFVFRAFRKFEKQEMDLDVKQIGVGRKVRKIRLGWMYLPLQTKEWLEELAREGLELESVYASVFTFRDTSAKHISYEVSCELKVSKNYFATHKEMCWQLKYASISKWLHYSIWSMSYEDRKEVPAFTYDPIEKKRYVKKAFMINGGMGIFILLVSCQSLYINLIVATDSFFEWSILGGIRVLLIVCIVMWILLFSKILTGFRREMKMLNNAQE